MEETSARKCENCGGELRQADGNMLKCPYCGSTYSVKKPEQPKTLAGGTLAGEATQYANSAAYTEYYDAQEAKKGRWPAIFLVFAVIVIAACVVAAVITYQRDAATYHTSAAISLKNAANTPILSEEEQKEARMPHIKKTYPDAEIAITKHRVGMDAGSKVIFIGYHNKSKRYIFYLDVDIQLFDAQGREITVPDSEKTKRFTEPGGPGKSISHNWALEHGEELAKTVQVRLKRVVLDSVVWDY